MYTDAQRIAETVLDNISNTVTIKEILAYLPKTFEYYKILPQANKLPPIKSIYCQR